MIFVDHIVFNNGFDSPLVDFIAACLNHVGYCYVTRIGRYWICSELHRSNTAFHRGERSGEFHGKPFLYFSRNEPITIQTVLEQCYYEHRSKSNNRAVESSALFSFPPGPATRGDRINFAILWMSDEVHGLAILFSFVEATFWLCYYWALKFIKKFLCRWDAPSMMWAQWQSSARIYSSNVYWTLWVS